MATANPNFHFQQQALNSLRQIHLVCMVLQGLHVLASLFVLAMGYVAFFRELSGAVHLYAMLLYLFSSIFAHVVVFYVLYAVARSVGSAVKNAFEANPTGLDAEVWRELLRIRPAKQVLPYFLTHVVLVLGSIFLRAPSVQAVFAWGAAAAGALALVRVFYAMKLNSRHVTAVIQSPWLNRYESS